MKGFDCATPLTASTAAALKAAGMQFVARYVVPTTDAWKRLTQAEAEAIIGAGLEIISIFETTANSAAGGASQGASDGATAYAQAQIVGQPRGTAIYFAVDYDAPSSDFAAITAYLQAAQQQLGDNYQVGVYGSYAVVEAMAASSAAAHFWQTYAWSNGQLSSKANIYQYENDQTIAGVSLDLDNSYGNEGGWSEMTFTDVPSNYSGGSSDWSRFSSLGLMIGYSDGTFKPGQALTRAEMAEILYPFARK